MKSPDDESLRQFTTSEEDSGIRIDRVLASKYPTFSRAYFQYLLEEGAVQIEGKKAKKRHKLAPGEVVEIAFLPTEECTLEPQAIDLDILYEDEHIIAINKPAGLVVHPGAGNPDGTFVNALLHHCQSLDDDDSLRPGIVHRLDKETSGVLLAAKSARIKALLTQSFSDRRVEKEYVAITTSAPKGTHCDLPIGRHPKRRQEMATVEGGKEASTRFEILQSGEEVCLVRAHPKTGRTHQIRVHLRHLGAPILGDKVYGKGAPAEKWGAERQMLHAHRLELAHPVTGEPLILMAPLPEDMKNILQKADLFCETLA